MEKKGEIFNMQASTGSLLPLKDGSGSSGHAYNLRKNNDIMIVNLNPINITPTLNFFFFLCTTL